MFFNIFSIIVLVSALLLIIITNPILCIFVMVLLVFSLSSILLLMSVDYIGLLLILIYVGAIVVLYIFLIMLLNVRLIDLKPRYNHFIIVGFFNGIGILFFMLGLYSDIIMVGIFKEWNFYWLLIVFLNTFSNIMLIGYFIFLMYGWLFLYIGIILLLSIFIAIYISVEDSQVLERKNLFQNKNIQISRIPNIIFYKVKKKRKLKF